jgi:hypothetical protein
LPNSQNLRPPWKKGQSGNPKGRPRLPDIRNAIARVLADDASGQTALDEVLMALCARAKQGDVRAAEFLLDRAYGKATQHTDLSTHGDVLPVYPPIVWSDGLVCT